MTVFDFEDLNEDVFEDDSEIMDIDSKEQFESLTLLQHIDSIVTLYPYIHNSHTDRDKKKVLQGKLDKHLAVCSNIFEISPLQSLLFSFILNSGETSLKSLSASMRITKVLGLNYLDDLDVLTNRRLIRSRNAGRGMEIMFSLGTEDRATIEAHHYWVPNEVIQAVREGKTFAPPHYRDLTKNQFFKLLKNLFRNRNEDEISWDIFIMDFSDLFENNPHLEFVRKLNDFSLSEENRIVLSLFCTDFFMNCRDRFSLSERDLLPFIQNNELADKQLFEKKLIEYDGDGFKDEHHVVLTKKAVSELLGMTEFKGKKKETAETDSAIIKCEAIVNKELFYNESEGKLVSQLTDLLHDENFNKITGRLKSKGMRAGFTCLFFGSPGTGKTETAYQLARITGRDIIPVDISATKSHWFGDSEKITRDIFSGYRDWVKKAVHKNKPVPILLINEADAFISKRKDVTASAVAQTENTIQNIILEELEKLEGILLATTNLTENIDFAFDRRFIYKIEFKKPGSGVRQSIWKSLIPELSEQESFELANNFTLSGGQMENIARKRMITSILTGTEPSLAAMTDMCKAESLVKDDTKVGF